MRMSRVFCWLPVPGALSSWVCFFIVGRRFPLPCRRPPWQRGLSPYNQSPVSPNQPRIGPGIFSVWCSVVLFASITLASEVQPSNNESLEAELRQAKAAASHGKLDEARDGITRCIALARNSDPPAPDALVNCLVKRGELAFGRGDWAGAEKDYLTAQTTLPEDVAALEHLGELRAAQRHFSEAVSLYQRAIKPVERPELLQALGDVYEFAGDTENAGSLHAQALAGYLKAANAGHEEYDRFLAGFYADVQPDPAESLRWARRATENSQDNVYAGDALAWALYKNGRWTEAADEARKVVATGTRDAHVLYRAGMILSRAGDLAEGGKLLREVTAVNPKYFNTFHAHR